MCGWVGECCVSGEVVGWLCGGVDVSENVGMSSVWWVGILFVDYLRVLGLSLFVLGELGFKVRLIGVVDG